MSCKQQAFEKKNDVKEHRQRDHAEITPQILWSIGLKSNKTHSSSRYFHTKIYKYWKYTYVQD